MGDVVLELKGIVKSFPGVLALDGIDFELKSGEVHAICGENGAGKSTLMKVVCGVHKADSGTMVVNGKTEDFANPMEAYGKGVSIIFQETSLFEEMTVLDNLFLGHEMTKKAGIIKVLDYSAMRKEAERIFQRLNTKMSLDAQIKTLGMAQKQMVEIAKALTFDANIIIFDEPTASLTEREVKALFKIINGLKEDGFGIVYISHRMEEIFELCDRVTVVRDGQYISTKNIAETNKDELVADMVGRKMGSYYPKSETVIGGEIFRVEGYYDEGFLENINFHVNRGEILGFAGLAGAGRTELMESICGFTGRAAGSVWLEGKKLNIHSYKDAMADGIVYVSEDRGKYGLIVDMSIQQNISLPQLENFSKGPGFLDEKKERAKGEAYIKEVGIKAPAPDFLVANLSGGNQQKVLIGRWLLANCDVIMLDEPTRGVDVGAKYEIYRIMQDLVKKGKAIIMVSSEMPELLGMSDRIMIMCAGKQTGILGKTEATQVEVMKYATQFEDKTKEGVSV